MFILFKLKANRIIHKEEGLREVGLGKEWAIRGEV